MSRDIERRSVILALVGIVKYFDFLAGEESMFKCLFSSCPPLESLATSSWSLSTILTRFLAGTLTIFFRGGGAISSSSSTSSSSSSSCPFQPSSSYCDSSSDSSTSSASSSMKSLAATLRVGGFRFSWRSEIISKRSVV